jgi:hypothetical protein
LTAGEGGSASSSAPEVVEGDWCGTLERGTPFEFNVARSVVENAAVTLAGEYSGMTNCTWGIGASALDAEIHGDGTFSGEIDTPLGSYDLTVDGSFDSERSASGTLEIDGFVSTCVVESGVVGWTAEPCDDGEGGNGGSP